MVRTHTQPGAQRQLRALVAAGWRRAELAPLLGRSDVDHITALMWYADRGHGIQVVDATAIADVFRHLAHQRGPGLSTTGPTYIAVRRNVNAALRAGWRLAADWAGIDIDDPDAQPRPAARIVLDDAPPSVRTDLGPDDPRWHAIQSPGVAVRDGVPLVRVDTPSPSRGRGAHAPTLTDQDVWAVRDHWVADVVPGRLTFDQLVEGYGVTTRTVLDIVSGLARPHLMLTDLRGHRPAQRPAQSTTRPIPPAGTAPRSGVPSGGPRMLPLQPRPTVPVRHPMTRAAQ